MTAADIQNKMMKYTPAFIQENDILDGLYSALSSSDAALLNAILNLPNITWTGKGLRKIADLLQVVYNSDDLDADIQTKIINAFTVNMQRGTEAGILNDLRDFIGDPTLSITLYDNDNCGIIVDKTYIGVDPQAIVDVHKAIAISYTATQALFGTAEFGQAKFGVVPLQDVNLHLAELKRRFIPIDVTIISVN